MKKESALKRFISNSLVFFIGTILSKMVSFLLMPLYTTKVQTDQLGIFDTSVTLGTMLFSICYFEIWSAILRFLYSKENLNNKNGVIRTGWKLFAISTSIFTVVCVIMCIIMRYDYIYLVVGYGIANALSNQMTFITRGLGLNKAFSMSGIVNTTVHLVLNIVLLAGFSANYAALYISYIIGVIAQVMFLKICIAKNNPFVGEKRKSDKFLFKEMCRYSLPLCFNTVSYWLLTSFNRVVYNLIYGNSASGIFSIGSRFGSIIALATTCFTYAWQDLAFSKAEGEGEETSKLYTNACDKYQQFLSVATVLLLPFINIIFPILVKGEYRDALMLVPSFVVVAVLSGYNSFVGNVLYAIKEIKAITLSSVIAAIVNISLCYPLIMFLGGNGTNISTIFAMAVMIGVKAICLYKKVRFDIRIKNIAFSALWIGVTTVLYYVDSIYVQFIVLVLNMIVSVFVFRKDIKKGFNSKGEE